MTLTTRVSLMQSIPAVGFQWGTLSSQQVIWYLWTLGMGRVKGKGKDMWFKKKEECIFSFQFPNQGSPECFLPPAKDCPLLSLMGAPHCIVKHTNASTELLCECSHAMNSKQKGLTQQATVSWQLIYVQQFFRAPFWYCRKGTWKKFKKIWSFSCV